MYAVHLLGFLLFAYQIILNGSSVVDDNSDSVTAGSIKPSTTPLPSLPEGYVKFSKVHAAYKLHEENATWYKARDRCIAEGAHLAITDSAEKIEFIKSLKTDKDVFMWIHVGIQHTYAPSRWVRVDNDLPPSFIPWSLGNPHGNGNCVGISVLGPELIDYPCNSVNEWFACEIFTEED